MPSSYKETKVIDNFLTKSDFKNLQEVMMSDRIRWVFNRRVAFDDSPIERNECYFTHSFYNFRLPESDVFMEGHLDPILDRLETEIWIRIKGNLYPATETLYEHQPHRDYAYPHNAALFSINTCDGGTRIGDDLIASKENRIILFDGHLPHNSTTCTDTNARININLNWLQPKDWEETLDRNEDAYLSSQKS